jgi:4-carboxymuconolactone decarboxylase
MPRIPYAEPDSLPDDDRAFLHDLPKLNIHRLLAGCPSMFQPLVRLFDSYLNHGLLTPRMREMVILRTAHLRNSEYELVSHLRVARLLEMTDADIGALAPGADAERLSREERTVLQFVDEVVKDGGASKERFDAVSKFLTTAEMIELTAVIGVYTMVSQICATFEIKPEEVPIANTGLEEMRRSVEKLD